MWIVYLITKPWKTEIYERRQNLKTDDVMINTLEGESLNSEVMNVVDRKILHLPLKKKDGNKVEQKSRRKTKMNVLTNSTCLL